MSGKTQAEVVTMLRNTPQGSVVSLLVSRQEEVDERFTVPRELVTITFLCSDGPVFCSIRVSSGSCVVGVCVCNGFFWGFFCVPQLYLWGSPLLGEIFAYVTVFNPTIKVVTFRLRGWCVLGVFLLPAFTRLGHERQDLLSPCDEMHVCTD